jgi:hypothetical protein
LQRTSKRTPLARNVKGRGIMPRPFVVSESSASTCDAPAPWILRGEAIVLPLLRFENRKLFVGAQMWVRYDSSPVGAYDEYAVAKLARVGANWGPHIIEMAVSSEHSMRCGRANWGFPKVVRALKYLRRGLGVRFEDSGRRKNFRLSRAWVPIVAPAWCVQVLEGQSVRVPMSIRGRARLCWSGRRVGVCVEGFEFAVQPPR